MKTAALSQLQCQDQQLLLVHIHRTIINLTTNQSKLLYTNTTKSTSLKGHHQHSQATAVVVAAAAAGHQQHQQPTAFASKLRHTHSTLNPDSTELKANKQTISFNSELDTATPSTRECQNTGTCTQQQPLTTSLLNTTSLSNGPLDS
jgi:hypothetical protein